MCEWAARIEFLQEANNQLSTELNLARNRNVDRPLEIGDDIRLFRSESLTDEGREKALDAAEGKITRLEESLAQETGKLTQAGLLFY